MRVYENRMLRRIFSPKEKESNIRMEKDKQREINNLY
jgi:hypothetical protein